MNPFQHCTLVNPADLYRFSATELIPLLRSRQLRSRQLVTAYLDRIDHTQDLLNAFITLCPDQALAAADQADAALDRGAPVGLLTGIPFPGKDLTDTAGVRTTYGSRLYQDHVPTQDAVCVERLKAAGGILIGKTSVPEFGLGTGTHNQLIGATVNPYDFSKSCGDSSGGSAVAVAAGLCPLAHGGDLGGSVRTPASFCGIVGVRPSIGRIPQVPKRLPWETLTTDGVLARTVEVAALMLAVMSGSDPRDPLSAGHDPWPMPVFSTERPAQLRIGYSLDLGITPVDQAVAEIFHHAIDQIRSLCPHTQPDHPHCTEAKQAFARLRGPLLHHNRGQLLQQHPHDLSPDVRWEIEQGLGISAADFLEAEAARGRIYHSFMEFFQRYDILATVSATVPPFPLDQPAVHQINDHPLDTIIDYLQITYTISLTGLPCCSIPCGWTFSGLPIGLQLIGQPWGETQLLQFAFSLQELLGFRHRWPQF